MLMNSGVNLKEIQKRLGHANIRITYYIYAYYYEDSQRNAIDMYERHI
jgi:integrase